MHRIVASITTLDQPLDVVVTNADAYRPDACAHCRLGGLWRHGGYHRKADRSAGDESRNPVAVVRFRCRQCWRTCSPLPLCIAPRRGYAWAVQQAVLARMLAGCSVPRCSRCTCRARRTVRRWRAWLDARSEHFALVLRSRFPERGRWPDRDSLWRDVIDARPLARAKAWLDRELSVP